MKQVKLKASVFFISLISCLFANLAFSQSSLFSFEQYVNSRGDTLRYRQLFPDADTMRKYPLVIFLHGSGESGNDNEAQLKWGVMNFATDQAMTLHPAIVAVPQCPAGQSWSVFDDQKSEGLRLTPNPTKPFGILMDLIQ